MMTRTAWIVLALLSTFPGRAPHADHRERREHLRPSPQLRALNAQFLSHDSATAVLQALCDRRAPGQRIVARKAAWPVEEGALEAARADLAVGPEEAVRLRQVELTCAGEVLSAAENWYLPARLTPEMNRSLEETRVPFGVVAAPLRFRREVLETTFLPKARPSEPASARRGGQAFVLRHRALLKTPDGRPFSRLVETYTEAVLR